jgi:hypothetical protein
MVYRDWLVRLAPIVADYLSVICRKRRATMEAEIVALYELAQQLPRADLLGVLELAAEQQLYGVEYLRAILAPPDRATPSATAEPAPLVRQVQRTVERNLAEYECYVANRSQLLELGRRPTGGAA